MPNFPFIGTEALTTLGCQIMPDIAMSAYYDRQATFDKLGIKVISGDEFQNVRYALRTKGGTTRRKEVGDTILNEGGKLVERKLVTYVAWNRYPLNKNMFRELPRKVGEQLMYPQSEINLRTALQDYVGDVFDNLFFGDVNGNVPERALYDGFWTYLKKDIEDGYLKPIALTGAIVRPTTVDDVIAWNLFVQFMDKIDPALRRAAKLIIMCSPITASAIYTAYSHAHGDHKEMGIAANGNYTVAEYPNVEIAFDDVLGIGCRLVATVPDNFEYGVDTLNPENGMSIEKETSRDNDNYIMQPQSAQGTRVFQVDPKHFAMTNASMSFEAQSGDYRDIHLYATANNAELGTVTVAGKAPDADALYATGETVELKATAAEGATFKGWSDGVNTATRTIVIGTASAGYMAIFEKA